MKNLEKGMNKDTLNISKIETYLNSIIDNVVSKNTYAGTLPDIIKSDWADMCLIDCGIFHLHWCFGLFLVIGTSFFCAFILEKIQFFLKKV